VIKRGKSVDVCRAQALSVQLSQGDLPVAVSQSAGCRVRSKTCLWQFVTKLASGSVHGHLGLNAPMDPAYGSGWPVFGSSLWVAGRLPVADFLSQRTQTCF
jgi:hypothetical protein